MAMKVTQVADMKTSVRIIRDETGDATVPIHLIGGIAGVISTGDAATFVQTAESCDVEGLSLYDYRGTKSSVWPVLARASFATSVAGC